MCWYLPHADRRETLIWPESNLLRYLGLAATAIGMAIRIIGMMQLGQLFSGLSRCNQSIASSLLVVTVGFASHLYGSLLAFVGFFLIFRSKIVLIAAPAYLIGTLYGLPMKSDSSRKRLG